MTSERARSVGVALAVSLVALAIAPQAAGAAVGVGDHAVQAVQPQFLDGGSEDATTAGDGATAANESDGNASSDADDTPGASDGDTQADSPGASLAGAIGGEGASLSGELAADTHQVAYERADSPAERRAVLERMAADLEASGEELREHRAAASDRDLHPGQRAHLAAQATVREAVVDELAAHGTVLGTRLARQGTVSAAVVERFREIGESTEPASNVTSGPDALPEGDAIVPDDWGTGTLPGGTISDGTPTPATGDVIGDRPDANLTGDWPGDDVLPTPDGTSDDVTLPTPDGNVTLDGATDGETGDGDLLDGVVGGILDESDGEESADGETDDSDDALGDGERTDDGEATDAVLG